ncbi:MAG: hypothetical protein ACPGRZ_04705 [Alphaproteobacteria bacterium]
MRFGRPILCLLIAGAVLQACTTFGRLHGERRDVSLSWAKYSSPFQGLAIYDGFKKGYELYIDVPRDDQCNGFARIENRRWALACPDGSVIQGTLSDSRGGRISGPGRDADDRTARLEVRGTRE